MRAFQNDHEPARRRIRLSRDIVLLEITSLMNGFETRAGYFFKLPALALISVGRYDYGLTARL